MTEPTLQEQIDEIGRQMTAMEYAYDNLYSNRHALDQYEALKAERRRLQGLLNGGAGV